MVVDNSNDRSNLLNFGANEELAISVETASIIATNDSNSRDGVTDTNTITDLQVVQSQPESQELPTPPALSLLEMLGEENVYKLFVQVLIFGQ